MLQGSVRMTFVMFNGGHVPVDGAGLIWLITALQQLQRPLTLVQCLLQPVLSLKDPVEQRGHREADIKTVTILVCCTRQQIIVIH